MNRNHMVAIVVGVVLIAIVWFFVVPLLIDLNEKDSSKAGFGWLVLVGATLIVGWIMFRPPGYTPEAEAQKIRKRQGLRRSEMQRRRRNKN